MRQLKRSKSLELSEYSREEGFVCMLFGGGLKPRANRSRDRSRGRGRNGY